MQFKQLYAYVEPPIFTRNLHVNSTKVHTYNKPDLNYKYV